MSERTFKETAAERAKAAKNAAKPKNTTFIQNLELNCTD